MTGERDFELAERSAEMERQAGVIRIRAQSQFACDEPDGPLVCDCGDPIGDDRRRALPKTRQCINCATFHERQRRRHG